MDAGDGMTAFKLELYDRYWYYNILKEPWLETKYLNSNDATGLFEQSNEPNLQSSIIFEKSIRDDKSYVCVKVGDEARYDFKI